MLMTGESHGIGYVIANRVDRPLAFAVHTPCASVLEIDSLGHCYLSENLSSLVEAIGKIPRKEQAKVCFGKPLQGTPGPRSHLSDRQEGTCDQRQ